MGLSDALEWIDTAREDLQRGDRIDALDSLRMAIEEIRGSLPADNRAKTVVATMGTVTGDGTGEPLPSIEPAVADLAFLIADTAVRADIECFAHGFIDTDGRVTYDLTRPLVSGVPDAEAEAFALLQVRRAALYIDHRADVFPWRLVGLAGSPNLVRFEAKP